MSVDSNSDSLLERALAPFSTPGSLINYVDKSSGREWLMNLFDAWSSDFNSSQFCVFKGVAGVGKTAFVTSRLLAKENVIGVHYCKYFSNDRLNPKRVMMYFAYCLSRKLPEYKECLINSLNSILNLTGNLELIKMGADNLFTTLISAPLSKCATPSVPLIFVIDAINTSFNNSIDSDESEIIDFLKECVFEIPNWIKFFITDRSSGLESLLSDSNPYMIEEYSAENETDIFLYIDDRLKNIEIDNRDEILKKILQKCEGSFLYAERITEDIVSGRRKIENYTQFPPRISGIYADEFKYLFGNDLAFYSSKIRPLFEILVSSRDQIEVTQIAKILNWRNGEQEILQDKIKDYFPVIDGYFVPTNKGLFDWLTTPGSRKFKINIADGIERLLGYYYSHFETHQWEQISDYPKRHLVLHLIDIKRYNDAGIVLSSRDFMQLRIKLLGIDEAIRRTLNEIARIPDAHIVIKNQILCSDMIKYLLAHHRTFLYNSGLYFELKKCGFDNIQEDYVDRLWCDKAKIGWANYLYITERFSDSESYLKRLIQYGKVEHLSNRCQKSDLLVNCDYIIDSNDLAGLHNTLALCYRKYVDFDKALHHFKCAENMTVGEKLDSLYEKSIAIVNMGKIDYHLFKWEDSIKHTLSACDILERCKKVVNEIDKLIELDLFIAEYNRLAAEASIWNKKIEDAGNYLSEAARIYSIYQIKDRYHIRFLYTDAFLNIVKGNPDNSLDTLLELSAQAKSDYDKSQILYYSGIAHYLLANKSSNEIETSLMASATYAKNIDAKIEYYQVLSLKSLISKDKNAIFFDDNEVIKNWCDYTVLFFSALKSQAIN